MIYKLKNNITEGYKNLTGEIPEKFETFDFKAAAELAKTLEEPELGPVSSKEVKVVTTGVPSPKSKVEK